MYKINSVTIFTSLLQCYCIKAWFWGVIFTPSLHPWW